MTRTRLLAVAALSCLLFIGTAQTAAASDLHLSGGGTASISQVAFNVTFGSDRSASGSFECLMAGRSASVLPAFGLSHIMAVHATPTKGTAGGSVATFSGPAKLVMDNGMHRAVHVSVWADAATQSFQLT